MKRIARDAQLLDITHGIAPQAVLQGALVLARALPVPAARRPPRRRRSRASAATGARVAIRDRRAAVSSSGPTTASSLLAADECGIEARPQPDESPLPPRRGLADLPRPRHLRAGRRPPGRRAPASTISATRSTRRASSGSTCPPRPSRTASSSRRDRRCRPLRQSRAQRLRRRDRGARARPRADRVELGFALTPYYAVVAETYADAGRGELILYEDSYGAWAIAINGGNAAALTERQRVGDEPYAPG